MLRAKDRDSKRKKIFQRKDANGARSLAARIGYPEPETYSRLFDPQRRLEGDVQRPEDGGANGAASDGDRYTRAEL